MKIEREHEKGGRERRKKRLFISDNSRVTDEGQRATGRGKERGIEGLDDGKRKDGRECGTLRQRVKKSKKRMLVGKWFETVE